jgi:hypothetical protein
MTVQNHFAQTTEREARAIMIVAPLAVAVVLGGCLSRKTEMSYAPRHVHDAKIETTNARVDARREIRRSQSSPSQANTIERSAKQPGTPADGNAEAAPPLPEKVGEMRIALLQEANTPEAEPINATLGSL